MKKAKKIIVAVLGLALGVTTVLSGGITVLAANGNYRTNDYNYDYDYDYDNWYDYYGHYRS